MRSTRALVGSVGAGLCLVAAAVTVLFVLSAVVAVRGWPGIDPGDDVPRVTLADASLALSPDVPEDDPVAVASLAGGTAPIVLGGAEGDDDAAAPRRPGPQRRVATGDRPAPAPTPDRSAATPQAGATTSTPAAGSGDGPVASNPVTETIRDTAETAGGVTDPVAPGSGSTVTQVTDTVAGTVDDTVDGGTVEQITDAVGTLAGGR